MSAAPSEYPGTPRWVKIVVAIALILLLLILGILALGFGGVHGPSRQMG